MLPEVSGIFKGRPCQFCNGVVRKKLLDRLLRFKSADNDCAGLPVDLVNQRMNFYQIDFSSRAKLADTFSYQDTTLKDEGC